MKFSPEEIEQIVNHGLTTETVEKQLLLLKNGFRPAHLVRPATCGDGIIELSDDEKELLIQLYEEHSPKLDIVKFVPASGAATRMFRDLYEFVQERKSSSSLDQFFTHLKSFAFYEELKEKFHHTGNKAELIEFLLMEKGMGYGSLPKGLIPFHKHNNKTYTPVESHLHEAMDYSDLSDGSVAVHFTFSPEHFALAENIIWNTVFELEDKYGVESFIKITEQAPSTDTIALDENERILKTNGELVFRPGGHGALLKNLNETEADLIFVRNIDNILPPHRNAENVYYKKILGGYLLLIRERIFELLDQLDERNEHAIENCKEFIEHTLKQTFPVTEATGNEWNVFHQFLNRPVRVCGMVKNEGEPGGGPFWVKAKSGEVSLQIVESSQIDNSTEQKNILNAATHFNPVDLVCSVKNYKGEPFMLEEYSDPDTSFISEKSFAGKKIKVLEHPGLWNGSMAGWITIFIEIPLSTFNPVKTVNDLLKEQHQK